VVEQAKALAARPKVGAAGSDKAKIAALYQLVFARLPDSEELAIGQQFIAGIAGSKADGMKLSAWEQYAQLLLLTSEAMYID
jgi:hypothetical protein